MYDNQDNYSKYLELLRKRYMRNGIIEIGDLSVESNLYELVAVLDNLEGINKKLAIATDNNSSLQILKKDYTTFYEKLRKKVVEEYNTLYDERIESLYTEVLNQVKIGNIEEDYRVVGKDISPYVLPEVVEQEEVKLSPEELKEVKVLSRIISVEEFEEQVAEKEGRLDEVKGSEEVIANEEEFEDELDEDFEEDELDEEDALIYGVYDSEEDFEDEEEFEDEDEFEGSEGFVGLIHEIEDNSKKVKDKFIRDEGLVDLIRDTNLNDVDDLGDVDEPRMVLPKNLKRSFSVGSEEPVRRSSFVPRTQNKGVFRGEQPRRVTEVPRRQTEGLEKPETAPKVQKVVKKPQDLNARVYDKLDEFGGRLVDKIVGRKSK
jgi:phage protein